MATIPIASVLARNVKAQALSSPAGSVVEAVRRAACVYGSAPTSHLALVLRTKGYKPADLDAAILKTRDVVRIRAMRGSVYLVPKELLPYGLAITKNGGVKHYAKISGLTEAQVLAAEDHIEAALEGKQLTAAEIRAAIGKNAPEGTVLTFLLGHMGREARIVRTAVRGGERSQSYEYARMSEWIKLPDVQPTQAEALAKFAPLWLQANGPATVADYAWWHMTSQREALKAFQAIGAKAVQVEGVKVDCYATDEVLAELGKKIAVDDEVYPLPCWDSYVMAYGDRSRYLDDAKKPFVLDKMGNATNVLLRAGRIVGTWDFEEETFLYALFEKMPVKAVEAAAKRLAPIHKFKDVREVKKPKKLPDMPKNAFLAPLT